MWNKSSKEVNAIKFAVFLGRSVRLEVLNGAHALTLVKFRLLNVLIAEGLEPLRYLKLMYLSHGRKKMAFVGLLLAHAPETSGSDTSRWEGQTSTRIDVGYPCG